MSDGASGEWARLLGVPLGVSAGLHVVVLAAMFVLRPAPPPPLPPVYRVDIVAAPPGPRQAGVVRPATPTPPAATPTPPPRAEAPTREPAVPIKAEPPKRTPTPASTPVPPPAEPVRQPAPQTPAPTAGGGPTGGRGADVATISTEGIEFPFPGYLNNIVRQIALNFSPPNRNAPLRAEVFFLIQRDGTVTGVRFITRSGNYQFDLEAQGAIEAAAPNFGRLPAGYPEDALPVVFSFDPRVLR